MLMRFESALHARGLSEKMLLLPGVSKPAQSSSRQAINLMVGYNGLLKSQIALDITLWIAHQTRLATQKQVTVQVVYVIGNQWPEACPAESSFAPTRFQLPASFSPEPLALACAQAGNPVSATLSPAVEVSRLEAAFHQDPIEQADQILWQARSLAEEWRGSLETHLRFGKLAPELRQAVQSQNADLLVLGCDSTEHPVVQQLGAQFPCPVVGVPSELISEEPLQRL